MNRNSIIAFVCLLLLNSGCTAKLESQVSGKVTLDGQPLTRGSVAFHAADSGTTAYGSVDAEGNYSVKTGTGEGIKPGEYVVVVTATEDVVPSNEPGALELPPKLLTPNVYASKNTSPLKFTVEPGEQTIDLPLESK